MQWCSVGAHAWFALKTVRAVAQTAAGKKVVPRIIRPLHGIHAEGFFNFTGKFEAKGSACTRNPVFHLGNPVYLSCSAESSAACSGSNSDPLQRVLQCLACEEELQEI